MWLITLLGVVAVVLGEVEFDVEYDLPGTVLPSEYHISLRYGLTLNGTELDVNVTGTTTIRATALQSTDRIEVHVGDRLHVDDGVTVVSVNGYDDVQVSLTAYLPARQILELWLSRSLIVLITANHSTSTAGNPAFMVGNENDMYVSTRFQPINARQVFPCVDEPGMKAVFRVDVELDEQFPEGTVVLHNTGVKRREENKWYFEATPIMSTNLLAIYIDQVTATCRHEEEKEFCVWQKDFVEPFDNPSALLDILVSRQSTIKSFFGFSSFLRYHVYLSRHIQRQFSAVETWGMVLLNYKSFEFTFESNRPNSIDTLMVHELLHYWTGNLMTPRHWRHMWLSEGLTTYLTSDIFHYGRQLGDTPCRRNELVAPTHITEGMNHVYGDSLAMLYKLRVMIGKETLDRLIIEFVRQNSYGSATTEDFINDVKKVLQPFDLLEQQRVIFFLEDALFVKHASRVTTRHRDNDRSFMITATNESPTKMDCLLVRNNHTVSLYWLYPRQSINLDNYIVFTEGRITYDSQGRWFIGQMCQQKSYNGNNNGNAINHNAVSDDFQMKFYGNCDDIKYLK